MEEKISDIIDISKVNKRLLALAIIGVLFFLFTILSYVNYFNGGIEPDTATWGEFGDFIGGTVNPIFGFLTFIGVLWTISLTYKELHSQKAQQTKEDIYRLVNLLYVELKDALNTEIQTGRILPVYPSKSEYLTIYDIFKAEGMDASSFYDLIETNQELFNRIHNMFGQMIFYLHEYDRLAGNNYVSVFFKTYFVTIVNNLCRVGAINGDLESFFEVQSSN